jgi:hypothetical protein
MPIKFYLDTNALLLLSGLKNCLPELSRYVVENHVELCTGQVQIDESVTEGGFNEKIEKATRKLKAHDIVVNLEPTIEAVVGVSRVGFCKIGSDKLGKIDDELGSEIECCEGNNRKSKSNLACDALIALSSLNHDYFITSDECLFKSWKKVIETNQENKAYLQKTYSIPKIIHRKNPRGILEAIMPIKTPQNHRK